MQTIQYVEQMPLNFFFFFGLSLLGISMHIYYEMGHIECGREKLLATGIQLMRLKGWHILVFFYIISFHCFQGLNVKMS